MVAATVCEPGTTNFRAQVESCWSGEAYHRGGSTDCRGSNGGVAAGDELGRADFRAQVGSCWCGGAYGRGGSTDCRGSYGELVVSVLAEDGVGWRAVRQADAAPGIRPTHLPMRGAVEVGLLATAFRTSGEPGVTEGARNLDARMPRRDATIARGSTGRSADAVRILDTAFYSGKSLRQCVTGTEEGGR